MDPISDMLVQIKNAQAVGKKSVSLGYSKIKWEIAKLLEKNSYLVEIVKKGKKSKKLFEVGLIYDTEGAPKISAVKRVSKLSRRVYRGFREIHPVRHGYGIGIYSTTKGLLTDREARAGKLGGEFLFEIY